MGEGVSNFQPGDEVYGSAGGIKGTGGALAEYMLADVWLIAKTLKFSEVAAAHKYFESGQAVGKVVLGI